MPLTELLRMISDEMNPTQERPSNSSDPSPRPETDFCELVWENGNVMMQGQTKTRKDHPTSNDYQSLVHKSQDVRISKNNFSATNSILGDFTSVVPSSETDDADMVPWLSYPIEDLLHNDYPRDIFSEFSGVTMNGISRDSHLTSREKKGSFLLKHHDATKVDSNTVVSSQNNIPRSGVSGNTQNVSSRDFNSPSLFGFNHMTLQKQDSGQPSTSSNFANFPCFSQNNIPRSDVSGITGGNTGNTQNVSSRDFNSPSLYGFNHMTLQKQDSGQPSTRSNFANFPCFSRSATVAKANLTAETLKRSENDEQRCAVTGTFNNPANSTLLNFTSACSRKEIGTRNPSVQAPVNENSELSPEKPTVEIISARRQVRKENVVINDTQQNHAADATMSKVGPSGEKMMLPVVSAPSVCSGNSVELASNERANDLKRKLPETTESECPSEEVKEESVGEKKAAHARASTKRIRATEVHNLSERRRRDRINEKMRELLELIPNCNKVDKASMLDEAIEYLKTLQLQLQMFSMGSGLYMQPMMMPPGMQPIHGAQLPPQFPPMGLGMGMGIGLGMGVGMGMGFGTNMSFQNPHYQVSSGASPFQGMPGSSLQAFGHQGQGLPMSVQRGQVHPIPGPPPLSIPMGINVSPTIAKDSCQQVMPSNIPNDIYMNQATNQATKERIQPPSSSHDR